MLYSAGRETAVTVQQLYRQVSARLRQWAETCRTLQRKIIRYNMLYCKWSEWYNYCSTIGALLMETVVDWSVGTQI